MAISFAYAQRLWASKSARYDYKALGEVLNRNCRMRWCDSPDGGYFEVQIYSTTIAQIHADHYVLDMGGWSHSPSTHRIARAVTGAHIGSDSSKGYDQPIRVGGYPYFPGMKLGTAGRVMEGSRRDDTKRIPDPERTKQFSQMKRWFKKVMLGRWDLGEFNDATRTQRMNGTSVDALIELKDKGELFIPHDLAVQVIFHEWIPPAFAATFDERVDKSFATLRKVWLHAHGYYLTITLESLK